MPTLITRTIYPSYDCISILSLGVGVAIEKSIVILTEAEVPKYDLENMDEQTRHLLRTCQLGKLP